MGLKGLKRGGRERKAAKGFRLIIAFFFICQQFVAPGSIAFADYAALQTEVIIPTVDPLKEQDAEIVSSDLPATDGSIDFLMDDNPLSTPQEGDLEDELVVDNTSTLDPRLTEEELNEFLNPSAISEATLLEEGEEEHVHDGACDHIHAYPSVDTAEAERVQSTLEYYSYDHPLSEPTVEEQAHLESLLEGQEPVNLSEALDRGDLRADYASAVVLEGPFTETDLNALRSLDFEVAVAVIENTLVAFTSGQDDKISTTSKAYDMLKQTATFLIHNHPGSSDGPSSLDIREALDAPALEYVIDAAAIHAYNDLGTLGTVNNTELLTHLNTTLGAGEADEAAARRALNTIIFEQDRWNNLKSSEQFTFRGGTNLATPSNSKYLYLNFHGQHFSRWGGYSNVTLGAYDRNGDTSSFVQSELDMISAIVAGMTDKFSPFELEIFSSFDYDRSQVSFTSRNSMEVVIGSGSSSFLGGAAGGVAYLNTWASSSLTSVLVFEDNLGNGYAKYVLDASAHEAGHGFGLYHIGDYSSSGSKLAEYHRGDGYVAPNLGVGYYSTYGLWSNGPSYNATTNQDALNVITNSYNAVDYRADDHSNSRSTATVLQQSSGQTVSSSGIIEQINDVDYYEFTTANGFVDILVRAPSNGMLDPKLEVLDANGTVVATRDVTGLMENLQLNLGAGTYYVRVSSTGTYTYDTTTGGYGYHLGMYDIDVMLPAGSFNQYPTLDPITDKNVDEKQNLTFTVSGSDPEDDPVTYSATGLPLGATFDTDTQVFDWTPGYAQAGTYTVTFHINDGVRTTSQDVEITVNNVNRTPVFNVLNDQNIWENQLLRLTLSGSDPDGDALTFSATGLPQGATLDSNTGLFQWTPDYDQSGTYSVTFQMTDGTEILSQTINIDVSHVNRAPLLADVKTLHVEESDLVNFTLAGSDPDGDTLTYSMSGAPAGATLDANTGEFTWTPAANQVAEHNITFTVRDVGLSANRTVTIKVYSQGDLPKFKKKGRGHKKDTRGRTILLDQDISDRNDTHLYRVKRYGVVYDKADPNKIVRYTELFYVPQGTKTTVLRGIFLNGKYTLSGTLNLATGRQKILRSFALPSNQNFMIDPDRTDTLQVNDTLYGGYGIATVNGNYTTVRYSETLHRTTGAVTAFEDHVFDAGNNFLYSVKRSRIGTDRRTGNLYYSERIQFPTVGRVRGTAVSATYKNGIYAFKGTFLNNGIRQRFARNVTLAENQRFILDPNVTTDVTNGNVVTGGYGIATVNGNYTTVRYSETLHRTTGAVTAFEDHVFDAGNNFLYSVKRSRIGTDRRTGNLYYSERIQFPTVGRVRGTAVSATYKNGIYAFKGTFLNNGIRQRFARNVTLAENQRFILDPNVTTDVTNGNVVTGGYGIATVNGNYTTVRYSETLHRTTGAVTAFEDHVFDAGNNFLYSVKRSRIGTDRRTGKLMYREYIQLPSQGKVRGARISGIYANETYTIKGLVSLNGVRQRFQRYINLGENDRFILDTTQTTDTTQGNLVVGGYGLESTIGDHTTIRYYETRHRTTGAVLAFDEHVLDSGGQFLYTVKRSGIRYDRYDPTSVTNYRDTITIGRSRLSLSFAVTTGMTVTGRTPSGKSVRTKIEEYNPLARFFFDMDMDEFIAHFYLSDGSLVENRYDEKGLPV